MKQEKNWTIIDIIRWGKEFFKSKDIDSSRLNIELLLGKTLNLTRIEIYTQFDYPLSKSELDTLREMILRRANREPLQYILGNVNFYGLEIEVCAGALIPRPETEVLVEAVLKNIPDKNENLKILDLCSGSGCISLALASNLPNSKVTGLEISDSAIELANKNKIRLSLSNVEFSTYNIFDAFPESFYNIDVIVSNPPYIPFEEYKKLLPEIIRYEPQEALTDLADGLTFYRQYAKIFPFIIKDTGRIFLEFGFGQKKEIENLFEINFDIRFINDFNKIPRIAILNKKKGIVN